MYIFFNLDDDAETGSLPGTGRGNDLEKNQKRKLTLSAFRTRRFPVSVWDSSVNQAKTYLYYFNQEKLVANSLKVQQASLIIADVTEN